MLAVQTTAARHAVRAIRPAPSGPSVRSAAQGALLHFLRDTEIFAQESSARRVYRVVSGAVRTVGLLCDGRRQIGAFYFPGDWFGIEAAPVHRFAAEAVSDAIVEAHDRAAMISLAEHPLLGAELIEATVKELSRAHDHLMLLGRKTAEEKVATFLLDLEKRGVRDLPMRRQDIADYLGLTIETVSRMLTQLQNAGVVRICNTRRLEVLDAGALQMLAA
jgi:CRP/FNR family nitrogen fixation transcriptional regulator